VTGVAIAGNETVKESRIRSYLRTRKDREFDSEVVQADVRRLLTTGMFRDVRTYTKAVNGGVAVTFEVFEQPTIRYVKFIGNFGITDKALAQQADLEVGDAMNLYDIEEAARKIKEFYRSKGYPKANVKIAKGDKPTDRGAVFLINEGSLQRISHIRFVGNEFVGDGRLKTQIESNRHIAWLFRGKVDRKKIEEDTERLTNYYRNFGFFKARVSRELTFDRSGRWGTLTFVINEGPRYTLGSVQVVGNERISSEELLNQMELRPGDFVNMGTMKRDEFALRDIYGSQGHIFAEVEPSMRFFEEPGKLDLVYKIDEGDQFRVGKINVHISGEYPHTRQNVVLNRISLKEGDIVDIREVRKSERRLKASQLFEYDPMRGLEPRIVIRPPDLEDEAGPLASRPRSRSRTGSYRGQSPDGEAPGPRAGVMNVDIYLFPAGEPPALRR
jgi:outer membrane protein insertion porin family